MRPLSWKTLVLTSVILLGGGLPTLAGELADENSEHFVLGEEYNIGMTGCITKGLADIVVKSAKEDGTGYPAYQVGTQYGVCGSTSGMTRFLEVYEGYREEANVAHPFVWYVRYTVLQKDGSWMELFGFTEWSPQPTSEPKALEPSSCNNDCI